MDETFAAVTIVRTGTGGNGSVELKLAASSGEICAISFSQDVCVTLIELLANVSRSSRPGPEPTKLPTQFAVGSARYEPIVLVRFEDDTPYGLTPSLAAELARALFEEAQSTGPTVAEPTATLRH